MSLEVLQEALAVLVRLKAEIPSGRWYWEPPSTDSWPQQDESLMTTNDEWYVCQHYCRFGESSVTSRGQSGQPGHEHLQTDSVMYGTGYDSSALVADPPVREFVLVMHRTLDGQIAVLEAAIHSRRAAALAVEHIGEGLTVDAILSVQDRAARALAEAILAEGAG